MYSVLNSSYLSTCSSGTSLNIRAIIANMISLDLSTSATITSSAKTLGALAVATTGTSNRITMVSAATFTICSGTNNTTHPYQDNSLNQLKKK
jgi:hypothetical protein